MELSPISVALLLAAGSMAIVVHRLASAHKAASRSETDAYENSERARMPREVAQGKLVISEKTFYFRGRRPFAAKTDQGFLTREGWLVLVESKTRYGLSPSDIVQISAQALAVAQSGKWRVAPWAYVRLAPLGAKPYYQHVNLLPEERIMQLWDRWRSLHEGTAGPVTRPHVRTCRSCALKARCGVAIRQ